MSTTTEVSGSGTVKTPVKVVDKNKVGFAGLTNETFLKLLIAQLQNQDPTDPTSNEQIVTQLSQMQSLQSNLDLSGTLKNLSNSQQLSNSASFLGRTIDGTTTDGKAVTGKVDRVLIREGQGILKVGTQEVPLNNVLELKG
jgi:flagellar basal-body rod modification protein FlgD